MVISNMYLFYRYLTTGRKKIDSIGATPRRSLASFCNCEQLTGAGWTGKYCTVAVSGVHGECTVHKVHILGLNTAI